ncbi:MAG: DUF2007 domain-containing protein [Burkholderiaceae bacterium]|jgi:hypothetical protein|nr:MAG: DUF2007 domain-containing protein [Burkholderiaceae bacterium]
MLRLTRAPNLALATLWADALRSEGLAVSVERAYLSGVAGELPPDQCSPELWLHDAAQEARARALLDALQHLPQHCWDCACGERVEGGFASCWACGRPMPP